MLQKTSVFSANLNVLFKGQGEETRSICGAGQMQRSWERKLYLKMVIYYETQLKEKCICAEIALDGYCVHYATFVYLI